MNFFDTSFVAPLLRTEATTQKVVAFLAGLPAGSLALSHWARLELSSVLARDVRMGLLDVATARRLDSGFDSAAGSAFVSVAIGDADFALAGSYVRDYATGLRSGDALHLAIAANRKATAIYSLDKGLLKAGKQLGLPVGTGIRLAGYPR